MPLFLPIHCAEMRAIMTQLDQFHCKAQEMPFGDSMITAVFENQQFHFSQRYENSDKSNSESLNMAQTSFNT